MTKLNYAKHPYRLKVTSSLTRSGSKTGSQKTPQYSGWVKLSFWTVNALRNELADSISC